ncbi:MAG: acyltransferase family protein [Rhizobiaceae bacterium]
MHGADALRGIAACAVVLHHLSHLVHKAPSPSFDFISSHFGLGVPLFFCISAFSMYHAYFHRAFMPGFAKAFLVRRYARLLPLFLLMFVLWSIWPFWLLTSTPLASLPSYLSMTFAAIPAYSTGYVPAAWSLGVEMLFYLMFPVMIVLCRDKKSCVIGFVLTVFLAWGMQDTIDKGFKVNVYYHAINPVLFGPCFFLGALIWLQFQSVKESKSGLLLRHLFAIAGLIGLIAAWWVSVSMARFFQGMAAIFYGAQMLVFLVPFTILLYGQTVYPSRLIVNRATRFLGTISYSIYLLHPYVLLIVTRHFSPVFNSYFPQQPGVVFWLDAIVTFMVLIPLSMITYKFVEVPGIAFGTKIARRIESKAKLTQ